MLSTSLPAKRSAFQQVTGGSGNQLRFASSRSSWRSGSTGSMEQVSDPRPALQYDAKQQQRLQRRCRRAVDLLERLQQPVLIVQEKAFKVPLPPAGLKFCKVRHGAL